MHHLHANILWEHTGLQEEGSGQSSSIFSECSTSSVLSLQICCRRPVQEAENWKEEEQDWA